MAARSAASLGAYSSKRQKTSAESPQITNQLGGSVIKEGFLMKRGHIRHNWKTRWFKLSDLSLRYYKRKRDKVPQGRIPLRNANLLLHHGESKVDRGREFVMQIVTDDGVVYPIQAPSNEEFTTWMGLIRDVIERLEAKDDADKQSLKISANGSKSPAKIMKSVPGDDNNDIRMPLEKKNAAVLPCDLPPGKILKRGILSKKGHIVENWKVRCFVLQESPPALSYFDPSKKNPKVLNTLSLHGATVFVVGKIAAQEVLGMIHPPEHLFCIKVSGGTLYLIVASTDMERDEWIEAIESMCRKQDATAS